MNTNHILSTNSFCFQIFSTFFIASALAVPISEAESDAEATPNARILASHTTYGPTYPL